MKTLFKKILPKRILNSLEFKNSIWLIAGRVVQMICAFFVGILTTRYLGPANYGTINYAMAYTAFFTSLCTLGINSIIIKDFVDHPEEQGTAIGTTIVLRAVSSFLSALMIVAIVSVVDKGEEITLIVSAVCSLSLVFQVFDTLNYWFQSRYESKITAIATLIAYLFTSLYKIILLVTKRNVICFAFSYSLDYIAMALCLFLFYKKNRGPSFAFSFQKGKQLLTSSYHYILSGMMVAIYGQTDRFMLKQMLNEEAVGYYSLAASLSVLWVFVLSAVIDSMYPTIMRLYKEGDINAFNKKNRQLYATVIYMSIFVSFLYLIFGRFIISILYGDAFTDALAPLRIITWYVVFSYLGVARNAWIVCNNAQKYLKYMYFSAAVINIGLNALLIPRWGATGAALASLITQISTSIILPCFIKDMRPNVKLMVQAFLLRGIR